MGALRLEKVINGKTENASQPVASEKEMRQSVLSSQKPGFQLSEISVF